MEAETQPIIQSSICEGCLSVNRKLSPLIKDESQKFFDDILDPLDNISLPLMLCWECMALTNRFVAFKHKIKNAHNFLVKFKTRQNTKLPTLSSLSTKIMSNTICSECRFYSTKKEDNLCDKTSENELETFRNINIEKNRISINNVEEYPTKREKFAKNKNVTLESLKLPVDLKVTIISSKNKGTVDHSLPDLLTEDREINYDDDDLNNVLTNENIKMSRNPDQNAQLNIKLEIDTDDNNEELFNKETGFVDEEMDSDVQQEKKPGLLFKSNKVKTELKIQNDDFDESDNEPLLFKKQKEGEVEKKPKKRRKKNESREPTKKSKTRREKPPGVVQNARVARQLRELNVAPGTLEKVVLSWEQVQEEREKALASETFIRQEYKCMDCVAGFNHSAKLHNHMQKHLPSAGDMVCEICKVRCKDKHSLFAHKRRHRVRWRCCICQAMSSRPSVSADHLARVHPHQIETTHTHKCVVCDHTEPTLGKLRLHMKSHAESQKCEVCGKTFRDKTALRTHLFIHKGEKEYACPQCGKRFLFKKTMEIHLVTHNDSEHLYCYECDVNFKNYMSYYQHMKYNLKHIDPSKLKYACELCDKKFAKAARLEEHNIAVHLKVTPIQCTVEGCNFWCSSRPVLRTHVRMIHRNMRARRNHVCHTCGKAYTTKKTLECHLRSHSAARSAEYSNDLHKIRIDKVWQIKDENDCLLRK